MKFINHLKHKQTGHEVYWFVIPRLFLFEYYPNKKHRHKGNPFMIWWSNGKVSCFGAYSKWGSAKCT